MSDLNRQLLQQSCERQLGTFGAMLFCHLIRFSGMPTKRLFVWAKLMQALLHPDGKGTCGGNLSRQYVSKWKSLVQSDGKTERETEAVELEFTASDFKLNVGRQQVTVLLAFERVSETLLINVAKLPTTVPLIVSKVIELEREVARKLSLDGTLGRTGVKLIWLPKQPAFQEAAANLSYVSAPSGPGNTSSLPRRMVWGGGESKFHPEDWTCNWLEMPVLPAEYYGAKGLTLAGYRRQTEKLVREFNEKAQREMNPKGMSPSIISNIRSRLVKERISG